MTATLQRTSYSLYCDRLHCNAPKFHCTANTNTLHCIALIEEEYDSYTATHLIFTALHIIIHCTAINYTAVHLTIAHTALQHSNFHCTAHNNKLHCAAQMEEEYDSYTATE